MPTRNRSEVLARSVSSVQRQSMTDWELIVVNDASTDDTADVLSAAVARDTRIRPLHLETRVGAAKARNLGIDASAGQLIAFIDDDDEWLGDRLEHGAAALHEAGPAAGLVHGPFIEVDGKGGERVVGEYCAPAGQALADLLSGNRLGHSTVMVRAEQARAVGGFDDRLPRLQDWDLWLRLAARTRFRCVTKPLVRVHLTRGSISTRTDALAEACELMSAKYRNILGRVQYAELCYALGQLLIRHGAGPLGRSYVRRAVMHYPWPPRRVAGGLLTHLGPRVYGAAAALHSYSHDDASVAGQRSGGRT